jgi:hypothetical protein
MKHILDGPRGLLLLQRLKEFKEGLDEIAVLTQFSDKSVKARDAVHNLVSERWRRISVESSVFIRARTFVDDEQTEFCKKVHYSWCHDLRKLEASLTEKAEETKRAHEAFDVQQQQLVAELTTLEAARHMQYKRDAYVLFLRGRRNWKRLHRRLVHERAIWRVVADEAEVFWKQDPFENISRMRLKLKRNRKGSRHLEASNLPRYSAPTAEGVTALSHCVSPLAIDPTNTSMDEGTDFEEVESLSSQPSSVSEFGVLRENSTIELQVGRADRAAQRRSLLRLRA